METFGLLLDGVFTSLQWFNLALLIFGCLIGLFVGAVALSVGYKLLMSWVEHSVSEQQVLEANVGSSDD